MANIRYVGLDVHAASISVAVADGIRGGEVRFLGNVPNTAAAIRALLKKLGTETKLHFCYEAGPCGYSLYWQLKKMDHEVMVIAPSLIPIKSGDRVKTDRRDAEKLARCLRAGELTAVWVPDRAQESLRDLVRAREAAKKSQLQARNQLSKFLLYHNRKPSTKMPKWGATYMAWLDGVTFEEYGSQMAMVEYLAEFRHATERVTRLEQHINTAVELASPETRALVTGLQTMRGVATITAATIAAEVGQMSRFSSAKQLMAYAGVVPSEHSSGGPGKSKRGGITKTGNAHLRRIVIESAWSYRHRPAIKGAIQKRQEGQSDAVRKIAWKAQNRLHGKYLRMAAREKPKGKVITAISRELLGFAWAIGCEIEKKQSTKSKAA